MYAYEYDRNTGGLILKSSELIFSKEPRPVYYKELDILGFDKFFDYKKDDTYPYMWAEANNYWYRGKHIARTKGGSLCNAPELMIIGDIEDDDKELKFIDIPAMVEKNKDLIEKIAQETIKEAFNTYTKFKNKVDIFYVAFSGGKDSIVTLDIVKRALPHNEFKVLFGDTGMEFPDTYKTVDMIEKECSKSGIDFIRAKSEHKPKDTWAKFGPPATVTRWCCSVHKTAPQILALREYTKKLDFTGMAFVGIRASESASRSDYDYISLGKKHKGQYSCNPILEWNSAELYTYMYSRNLIINEAYKKGNNRAGCLVCPSVSEKNTFFRRACYKSEVDEYIDIIRNAYKDSIPSKEKLDEFMENNGWRARMNGRDISIDIGVSEHIKKDMDIIKVRDADANWKQWIKTIGILVNDSSPYKIIFKNNEYTFEMKDTKDGYEVYIDKSLSKTAPLFVKLLKNVFRRSGCCVSCHECEVDCHSGCISMKDGKINISDDCTHCTQCHKVEKGCLVYKSLEMPKGGMKMDNKSLNCYSTHAPKMDWFKQYFEYKNEFDTKHTLGSMMYSSFKRFLRDSGLLVDAEFSDMAKLIDRLGLDNEASFGLMLCNLVYTPQINWFIKNTRADEHLDKGYITLKLLDSGTNERGASDVFKSLCRIGELPFSEVGFGFTTREKRNAVSITRTPWLNPEPLVILYSLYKFAENCGEYYQFTLTRLYSHMIDSDGISPTEIFGTSRDKMEKILRGLSINYGDFINASFTLDLDNITLNREKTSEDILKLF